MTHYTVVVEQESNGTFSAWVPGLRGVYAAADSKAEAKRAIREALKAHLEALASTGRVPEPQASVLVLRYDATEVGRKAWKFVGLGALLGRATSALKAQASRRNGRLGGRPRKALGVA